MKEPLLLGGDLIPDIQVLSLQHVDILGDPLEVPLHVLLEPVRLLELVLDVCQVPLLGLQPAGEGAHRAPQHLLAGLHLAAGDTNTSQTITVTSITSRLSSSSWSHSRCLMNSAI